jgi:hypothetical protein
MPKSTAPTTKARRLPPARCPLPQPVPFPTPPPRSAFHVSHFAFPSSLPAKLTPN